MPFINTVLIQVPQSKFAEQSISSATLASDAMQVAAIAVTLLEKKQAESATISQDSRQPSDGVQVQNSSKHFSHVA
jgi:hypothetical protein